MQPLLLHLFYNISVLLELNELIDFENGFNSSSAHLLKSVSTLITQLQLQIKTKVIPSTLFQTLKGGLSETRIEKRIVITGDCDIDHDQVRSFIPQLQLLLQADASLYSQQMCVV